MNAHAAEVLTLNYAPVCESSNGEDWGVVIDPQDNDGNSGGQTDSYSEQYRRLSLLASAGRDRLVRILLLLSFPPFLSLFLLL